MTITSVTWDRLAVLAAALCALGALVAVISLFRPMPGFPVHPAYSLILWVPLLLIWLPAARSTITIDDKGIGGLLRDHTIGWHAIRSARVEGNQLQVVPRDRRLHNFSLHAFRLRSGTPNYAMIAIIDPRLADDIAAALTQRGIATVEEKPLFARTPRR